MAAPVNYEENLYHLNTTIRQLRASLQLELDPDFFMKSVVDSILFVHGILGRIQQNLMKSGHLIQRQEYLRALLITRKEFMILLEAIPQAQTSFGGGLRNFQPQFDQCLGQNAEDLREISDLLDGPGDMSAETGDIITQDEYKYLFLPDED